MTHNGSVCGNDTQAALLALQFGEGHSWSVNFTKTNETYQGDFITFTYDTNDTAVFPDAKRKGDVQCGILLTKHPGLQVSDLVYLTLVGFSKVRTNNVSNDFYAIYCLSVVRHTCLLDESTDRLASLASLNVQFL